MNIKTRTLNTTTPISIPTNTTTYSNNNKGFTLIEMMVIVAVIGILMATGIPAYKSMMDKNKLKDATANFSLAIGRAKAISQRNEFGKIGDVIGATVCFKDNVVSIHAATISAPANCNSTSIWSGQINNKVTVKHTKAGIDFVALCFNNKGRMYAVGDCADVSGSEYNVFELSMTNSSATFNGALF